jgi:2-iminobutanoate/2-iminopropanoate deaminase
MSKTAITALELTPPVGPFSQAIEIDGFLYLSGQVGQDPTTGKLTPGGIAAETEQVFTNAAAVLRAAGMGFDDVISVRVFLTRIEDYQAVNAIYARQFNEPFPARTAIGVAALPLGASVEIDMIAKGAAL